MLVRRVWVFDVLMVFARSFGLIWAGSFEQAYTKTRHFRWPTWKLVQNVRQKLTIGKNDMVYAFSGLPIYVSEKPHRMTNLPCNLYRKSLGGRSEKYMKMYILYEGRDKARYIYVSVRLHSGWCLSTSKGLFDVIHLKDRQSTVNKKWNTKYEIRDTSRYCSPIRFKQHGLIHEDYVVVQKEVSHHLARARWFSPPFLNNSSTVPRTLSPTYK